MTRTIRAAQAADRDALVEVGRRSWLHAFGQTAPFALVDWWVRVDRVASLYRAEWREMLVLEDAGAIVGLVQPKLDEINGLWVHPRAHRTGAGRLLLAAGEDAIRYAGHRAAWLECSGFNENALAFYRHVGWTETARVREPHECGIDVERIRLERALG